MGFNWGKILHPVIEPLVKKGIDWDEVHPMGHRTEDGPVVVPPPKMEVIEIQLFTPEQLQLQSLIESGLIEQKDLVFATSIANAPKATPTQLKWVKTILDKIIGEPIVKYEFATLFASLGVIKRANTLWQGHPLKLNIATDTAKYPGAIYIVSEKPGLGYVGRIDLDHSVVIPKRCADIKEDLIRFLMDLNSNPAKFRISAAAKVVQDKFGVALVTAPPRVETEAQKVARGPFDPDVMQLMIDGNKSEPWRRK